MGGCAGVLVSPEPVTDTLAVQVLAKMTEDLLGDIDRRNETIARQSAQLDQMTAALDELAHQHRGAWREVERLRRLCRAAGVAYVASEVAS